MDKGKNSILGGLVWSFAERISAQLVSTVVGIILARLLLPEDYGLIAIVMVFISLCDVFVTSGLGSALVQKKNADSDDYNTAFVLSGILAIVLYFILFVSAPYIAQAYEMSLLCPVLRVLGLRLLITSYNTIQQSYIRRNMEFRRFFVVTIWGTIISGVIGVLMAIAGFGVWSLVAQYLVSSIVTTLLTYRVCSWRPQMRFSRSRAHNIWRFGWKVLCTNLVSTLEGDLRSLIVGKTFGSAELAFFDQGKKYPALLISNVNSTLNRVMLPTFARLQDDLPRLKETLRKAIRLGTYIIAPFMVGLFAVSDTFVRILLTEKWLDIVPFLQIFCVIYITRPLEEMCHQAVIALGRSDISLRIMILINATALATVLLAVFVFHSVLYMALLSLVNALVSVVCFLGATNRLVGYRIDEQMKDVIPSLMIAVVMGGLVQLVSFIRVSLGLGFVLQIVVGVFSYIVMSMVQKNDSFMYLKNKLLHVIMRNKRV